MTKCRAGFATDFMSKHVPLVCRLESLKKYDVIVHKGLGSFTSRNDKTWWIRRFEWKPSDEEPPINSILILSGSERTYIFVCHLLRFYFWLIMLQK